MFHRTLLDLRTSLHRSLHLLLVRLQNQSTSPSTATLQGGVMLWPIGRTVPLSQVMSPSLPSKSVANTLWLILDASEVYDTTDVGRLTSPLFSQEREVSANPFGFSFSQTHSSAEKSRRDIDPFSSVEKSKRTWTVFNFLERKVKAIEKWRVCKNYIKNSVRTKRHSWLLKKVDRASKVNAQLRQDYVKRSLTWTEEIGKCKILMLLFMKLTFSSNLRGWNFC